VAKSKGHIERYYGDMGVAWVSRGQYGRLWIDWLTGTATETEGGCIDGEQVGPGGEGHV
jgi:hypothetical protein